MDTDKMQLKLRAIAKHVGALADELDGIDKGIECENCNSYYVYKTDSEHLACGNCGSQFHINNESQTQLKETTLSIGIAGSETSEDIANALKDLPKRLEGSE